MTMVGDAYAAPLVAELRRGSYDLSSLAMIGTGGAATNLRYQRALLELLPQLTLINGYGSSETGNMGFGHSRCDTRTDTFTLREGGLVLSEDYSHFLCARRARGGLGRQGRPDSVGILRRSRCHPQDLSRGRRQACGDIGRPRRSGSGRDAAAVRPRLAGGQHRRRKGVRRGSRRSAARAPGDRRRVGGGPSQRTLGRRARRPGPAARWSRRQTRTSCTRTARRSWPRFKAPKEFIFVEQVRRLGNGKADYRWAKRQATEKAPMST